MYPKFAIKVRTAPIGKEDYHIVYKGKHNFNNTPFTNIIKALDSTDKSKMIGLRILGDFARDFNAKTVQSILNYNEPIF